MSLSALRVLYIEAGSGSGGSAAALARLIEALAPEKIEPFVMAHQRGHFIRRLERQSIPVEDLPIRRPASLRRDASAHGHSAMWENARRLHWPAFTRVVRRIGAFRPDVVHLNNSPQVAVAAIAAARWCRAPTVCHLRTARRLDPLELYATRWIHRLIPISTVSERSCRDQGVPAGKLAMIPDGIDVEQFAHAENRSDRRRGLGLADHQPLIGVVSRLVPGKGLELFLRAMRLVVRQCPAARAVIVGGECEETTSYPEQLRALATSLGLDCHVEWAGWSDAMSEWYAAFDVFVLPSLFREGLPSVCLEAMAHRLPIISTAVGGCTELVEDQVTGRLVSAGDARALARAIFEMIRAPGLRRRMGDAGYQRALSRFDIRRTATLMGALYRSLALTRR